MNELSPPDLHSLGARHGTDKVDTKHQYRGISFLTIYERFLRDRRLTTKKFLEIGVKEGSSLRLWEEYFPNATIYGVDINPRCKQYESERTKVLIGDQNDPAFLEALRSEVGEVDVVLDDGSHITRHQIRSFEVLYPLLRARGVYIIEDLVCSYEDAVNSIDLRKAWPGMKYNRRDDDLKNYRTEFVDFIEHHVSRLDNNLYEGRLLSVHHYPQIVIFENF